MGLKESWKYEIGGMTISGEGSQAGQVRVEVTEYAGLRNEEERRACANVKADDWREMVLAVEQKLIRRGDQQR